MTLAVPILEHLYELAVRGNLANAEELDVVENFPVSALLRDDSPQDGTENVLSDLYSVAVAGDHLK